MLDFVSRGIMVFGLGKISKWEMTVATVTLGRLHGILRVTRRQGVFLGSLS